jgi:hypothetical protein
MRDIEREEWTAAMRQHEREVVQLIQSLAHFGAVAAPCRDDRQQVIFINAQVIKHRISIALLASRLRERELLPA